MALLAGPWGRLPPLGASEYISAQVARACVSVRVCYAAPRMAGLGKLALSLAVLLLCALVGEIGLRVRADSEGRAPEHPSRSLSREWNWALQHLEAGSARLASAMRYDPDLGWANDPQPDGSPRVNSAGMRSFHEFSLEPQPGVKRIMFIGDSYTFGAGAEDGEEFANVIGRDYLGGWESLNLAVNGYGPDQALLSFERRGRAYSPDIVVLGFYVRGYRRMFASFRGYVKPWFELDEHGELELHGVPVMPPDELYREYETGERSVPRWGYSYLLGTWGKLLAQLQDDRSLEREGRKWQTFAALLRRFRDNVLASGAQPFLLIIPNRPEDYAGSVFVEIDRLAQLEARALGIPALSIAAGLGDRAAAAYRPRAIGGHFSAEGHVLVASMLADALVGAVVRAPDAPDAPE